MNGRPRRPGFQTTLLYWRALLGASKERREQSLRHSADPGHDTSATLRRRPSRVQRGLDDRGEPGPLGRSEPPAYCDCGEELADRAAESPIVDGQRLAQVCARGGRFYGWFLGRFGCNRRAPRLRQLHLVGTLVAPRSWRGVQRRHPARRIIHSLAVVGAAVQRWHLARLAVIDQPRGRRQGSAARQLVLQYGRGRMRAAARSATIRATRRRSGCSRWPGSPTSASAGGRASRPAS
jgi:hypothetical protein